MNAIILSCSSGVVILTVPKMCIRDRIKDAFKNGKAFIPFVTAGDPDLETTEKLLIGMSENGADIIEIGIPFSRCV